MANERLRTAILTKGLTLEDVGEAVGVDPKTVERWISGRTPYRKYQFAVAALLNEDIGYLFPDGRPAQEVTAAAQAELVTVYPHRTAAPASLWLDTFRTATQALDILVLAGFWLSEDQRFVKLLRDKAHAGVQVRILLGDPDCAAVHRRGEEEGIGDAIGRKIRNAIHNYRSLFSLESVEFRLHDTVLYNSIYRADDDMLVNPHVLGAAANAAPILHLRRLLGGDLFATYRDSFESVWSSASPLDSPIEEAA
jgi:transcriptional regulator with XRE-family HTH domain